MLRSLKLSPMSLCSLLLLLSLAVQPSKAQDENAITSFFNQTIMGGMTGMEGTPGMSGMAGGGSFGMGGYNGNPLTLMTNPGNWVNPNMYMQFMNPNAYIAMMNPMTYAQFINPMQYMQIMNPMAYMQLLNPQSYAGWIDPNTYVTAIGQLLGSLHSIDKDTYNSFIEQLKKLSEESEEQSAEQ